MEWVVSVTPWPRFTPGERTPGTHWIGGWVGPRAGLNAGARRKILCPCRRLNPERPARSQTLYCLSYRGSKVTTESAFQRVFQATHTIIPYRYEGNDSRLNTSKSHFSRTNYAPSSIGCTIYPTTITYTTVRKWSQVLKSCAGANMVYSRTERVFIL
jgi:hypothetical protein